MAMIEVIRFRRSTPVNEARENREAVGETFPFSPIYDNHSHVLPDSGYGSYTHFPSNVGSTVLTVQIPSPIWR